jgi:hypothetical protein
LPTLLDMGDKGCNPEEAPWHHISGKKLVMALFWEADVQSSFVFMPSLCSYLSRKRGCSPMRNMNYYAVKTCKLCSKPHNIKNQRQECDMKRFPRVEYALTFLTTRPSKNNDNWQPISFQCGARKLRAGSCSAHPWQENHKGRRVRAPGDLVHQGRARPQGPRMQLLMRLPPETTARATALTQIRCRPGKFKRKTESAGNEAKTNASPPRRPSERLQSRFGADHGRDNQEVNGHEPPVGPRGTGLR